MRTCVGCRSTVPKRDLIRVVRGADGTLMLDRRGDAAGRGAYVHRDRACVDRALERGASALVRAVHARADRDAAARLSHDIEGALTA